MFGAENATEVGKNGRIRNVLVNKMYRFADGQGWKRACHE